MAGSKGRDWRFGGCIYDSGLTPLCDRTSEFWAAAQPEPNFIRLDQPSPYSALCSRHHPPHGALDSSQFALRTVLRQWEKMADRGGENIIGMGFLLGTIIIFIMATIISISLFNFVAQIPISALRNDEQTDAIVVLTGGSGRLKEGLNLLMGRKAKKLFVSGVYRGVDVRRLLSLSQRAPDELLCCIEIGHAATSTEGNAAETKLWMDREGYRSIRLVTASYHMPRSIREFHHYMPQVRVVPHAVFPAQFKREKWWRWPGTASLILTEFAKYLRSSVRRSWENLTTHKAS